MNGRPSELKTECSEIVVLSSVLVENKQNVQIHFVFELQVGSVSVADFLESLKLEKLLGMKSLPINRITKPHSNVVSIIVIVLVSCLTIL